jgi:hypothetical protein
MEEIFVAEFIIHEVSSNAAYISKPAITIRFLEFPTLTIFGIYQKKLIFNKGKSCKFSMTLPILRAALKKYPLYVMLVDALPENIKMIGTSAADLSSFGDAGVSNAPDFKRNLINLYDPIRNVVARVDISISISQYTDGITRTPAEIFEKINYENIKATPPERQADKSIETDPLPAKVPGKVTFTSGTMTNDKPETKESQTSVFLDNYAPPPMFFTKSKTPVQPVYYPTAPPVYIPPPVSDPSSDLLIDRLIREVQNLKQISSLQQQWSYPPTISFQKPEKASRDLTPNDSKSSGTSNRDKRSYKSSDKDKKSSRNSIKKSSKGSVSEYSEDFEEEDSYVKSSSRKELTKCYVCGELVKTSEAKDHPANCKKIKEKVLSPKVESGENWGLKSINSIAEEYESDFNEESKSIS